MAGRGTIARREKTGRRRRRRVLPGAGLLAAGAGLLAAAACSPSGLRFEEVTSREGLAYTGPSYGAAAADYDGDGRPDLAVSRHGSLAVYRNRGGRRGFALLGPLEGALEDVHGLAWVDLDDDGAVDLFVSTGGRRGQGGEPNRLYRNRGGALGPAADLPDVLADPSGRGRCAVPYDYDGDGRLDLLVVGAPGPEGRQRLAHREGESFVDRAAELGWAGVRAECVVAFDPDGSGHPLFALVGSPEGARLLRRGADGRLEEVSRELGIDLDRPVLSVVPGDFDNDGDLDLYFVVGRGVPEEVTQAGGDVLFRLVERGRREVEGFRWRPRGRTVVDLLVDGARARPRVFLGGARRHPDHLPWTVPADAGVLDGDPGIDPATDRGAFLWRQPGGDIVLRFVGAPGMLHSAAGRIRGAELVTDPGPSSPARPHPTRNRLFENRGGHFVDVTDRAGVGDPASGRDAVFADLDDDGDLDLYVVNGGTAFANLPDVLYRNDGDGTFTDVTAAAGVAGPAAGRGCSALAFDYDGDGALDLFTTEGDGPPPGNAGPERLWHNRTRGGNWANLELVGSAGNRAAVGAWVEARFGGRRLALQRSAATGRFSTSLLPLHLGLGAAEEAEVEVRWPSGRRSHGRVRAGETLCLEEPHRARPH